VRIVQDSIPKTEILAEVTKTQPLASSAAVADRTEAMVATRSQHVPVLEARTEARSQEVESSRSGAAGRIAAGIVVLALLGGGGFYAVSMLNRPVVLPSMPVRQPVPPAQEAQSQMQSRPSPPSALSGTDRVPPRTTQSGQPSTVMNAAKEAAPASPTASAPKKAPEKAAAAPSKRERLDKLLAEADASYSRKNFAKAQSLANQALALDPGNAAALAIRDRAQKAAWSEVQIQ
jgi:hypothetical protein